MNLCGPQCTSLPIIEVHLWQSVTQATGAGSAVPSGCANVAPSGLSTRLGCPCVGLASGSGHSPAARAAAVRPLWTSCAWRRSVVAVLTEPVPCERHRPARSASAVDRSILDAARVRSPEAWLRDRLVIVYTAPLVGWYGSFVHRYCYAGALQGDETF